MSEQGLLPENLSLTQRKESRRRSYNNEEHNSQKKGCSFFLLTIRSFLLTTELLCLQLCCGAFLLTVGASRLATARVFYLQLKLSTYSWKVPCICVLMGCKQRSSTVDEETAKAH